MFLYDCKSLALNFLPGKRHPCPLAPLMNPQRHLSHPDSHKYCLFLFHYALVSHFAGLEVAQNYRFSKKSHLLSRNDRTKSTSLLLCAR